jgi:hypothetical protein
MSCRLVRERLSLSVIYFRDPVFCFTLFYALGKTLRRPLLGWGSRRGLLVGFPSYDCLLTASGNKTLVEHGMCLKEQLPPTRRVATPPRHDTPVPLAASTGRETTSFACKVIKRLQKRQYANALGAAKKRTQAASIASIEPLVNPRGAKSNRLVRQQFERLAPMFLIG